MQPLKQGKDHAWHVVLCHDEGEMCVPTFFYLFYNKTEKKLIDCIQQK